jgi:hypothetical protein
LFEWKVTPEYINNNWTEEQLLLLFLSRAKRYKRQADTTKGDAPTEVKVVPEEELFERMGYKPEVVARS